MALPPYKYDFMNTCNGAMNPSTQHIAGTGLALFFKRHLFMRLMSVFKWDVPEEWPKNYFQSLLFGYGYFAVVKTDKFGVIPQYCTLSGYDVFYQPKTALIANPLLQGIQSPQIGKDCELVRLCPDYGSAWDLVDYYGDIMALIAESMGMNLTNSKLAYAFAAADKASAESFKKLYDQVQSGDPAVFYDKRLMNQDGSRAWDSFLGNLKQNYICGDLQLLMEQMNDDFDAWIGIPNANVRKNAHILQDELHANDTSTYATASMWLETLKNSCERVNAMFDIDISVDWRNPPADEYEGMGVEE